MFDEAATVRRAADCDIWIPVLRPAPARPFEMALVIDGAITMAAWHETLREFRLVLERLGAFFDVRAWRLHAAPGPEGSLTLAPEGGNPRVRRKADELRDATGRRLVLVASDCVSEPWHDGRARDLLESWGRTQPVALLPMLPPSLWRYTGLGWATPILVRAPRPGAPNAALVAEPRAVRPARRLVPGGRPAAGGPTGEAKSPARVPVPVPVLPLQPEALVAWAQTLTSPFAAGVTALILRPASPAVSRPEGDHSDPSHPPGEARVERFARMSSPTAQELAGCFAAAPLRMSILRVVQRALLPDSDNLHLAEILLGGLFYPIPAKSDDPDDLAFEFYQGVREVLLDRQDISRSLEVFTTVTRWVSECFGQALDFQAILDDPDGFAPLPLTEENKPFASISAMLLKRLGGRYLKAARRLEGEAHPEPVPIPEQPVAEPTPVPLLESLVSLVGRTAQIDEIRVTLMDSQVSRKGRPIVFLLEGGQEQGHAYLIRRLIRYELPIMFASLSYQTVYQCYFSMPSAAIFNFDLALRRESGALIFGSSPGALDLV